MEKNKKNRDIEKKINALIKRMTLREKVMQTVQADAGKTDRRKSLALALQGVGSFFNCPGVEWINDVQRAVQTRTRLGIPFLTGRDVIHGFRTIFPVPLAMSASWDPDLVERCAGAAAREAYWSGIHWTFSPMVDIARDPRWGRIAEGSGEDPYLGGVMARAWVRGYQGADNDVSRPGCLAACAKHYVAYGAAEGGRDYNTTDVSLPTLWNVYLPPFQAAFDQGCLSAMSAFNDLNRVPTSANPYTLRTVLKKGWRWDGVVVSDWNSVAELMEHGIAADRSEAAEKAIQAGVDLDMYSGAYQDHLERSVRSGRVPRTVLDDAVRRILRLKFRLGLFDRPFRDPSRSERAVLTSEHRMLALEAARKTIVLLKNEGLLPLERRKVRTLAVIGPLADDANAMRGCWTLDGRDTDVVTVLNGLRGKLGGAVRVTTERGCSAAGDDRKGIARAAALARRADAVVLCVGETTRMSGEARNRAHLGLPGVQQELADAVLAAQSRTVVVLFNGRPLCIPEIARKATAIVEVWQPGIRAGDAVAEVLFGEINPGGKLTVTFPVTEGQIPLYYNRLNTGRPPERVKDLAPSASRPDISTYIDAPVDPLFPFGHGLSYTTFSYAGLRFSSRRLRRTGTLTVSARITNTGKRAGDEVVQCYVRDRVSRMTRPIRELKGFQRITLQPGESRTVSFILGPGHLGYYDDRQRWVVEPGEFSVWIAPSSQEGLEGRCRVIR